MHTDPWRVLRIQSEFIDGFGTLAELVLGVVARGAGRAEHRHRAGQLREHPEALDELGLDAQHPPRVGVHPVGRAARVEQPLVGGAGAHLAPAHGDGAALVFAGRAELRRCRHDVKR